MLRFGLCRIRYGTFAVIACKAVGQIILLERIQVAKVQPCVAMNYRQASAGRRLGTRCCSMCCSLLPNQSLSSKISILLGLLRYSQPIGGRVATIASTTRSRPFQHNFHEIDANIMSCVILFPGPNHLQQSALPYHVGQASCLPTFQVRP